MVEGTTCYPRRTMVSYQRWTSIAYDVAKAKGAQLEGSGTQQTNQNLVSVIAEVWNERKSEISTATVAEAKSIARNEISVSA